MEMVVTTGATRRAKLQSNHHQQSNTQLFYAPNALPVAQPTVSVHWRDKLNQLSIIIPMLQKWGLLKSCTHLLMTAQMHWCIEAILAGCPSRCHQRLTSGLTLKLAGYTPSNLMLSMAASSFHATDVTLLEQCTRRRRKHCVLAVVRRSQNFSPGCRPSSRGCGMAKI